MCVCVCACMCLRVCGDTRVNSGRDLESQMTACLSEQVSLGLLVSSMAGNI